MSPAVQRVNGAGWSSGDDSDDDGALDTKQVTAEHALTKFANSLR
jgi:hypothetical protein